ncbi:MAG: zf-HC2 domain-containing protein [Syntrophomonadaceae bacterium]|jgi:anti-sigma factor RsiW|nr:zf-HC2 domain-containing protein [Bacillota bacterium]NLP24594.1 hypothetical protein [Syntrophomonadaceae bacterium]
MRCEQIKENLSAYMDQMTSRHENQLIEAHLTECATCRQELEQLQLLHALLANLDEPQIPDGFAEDLHGRLLEARPILLQQPSMKRPRQKGWIAAAVAGLALVVGIAGSSLLPVGSIANLWLDDKAKTNQTTTVAVEDIIQRFQQWRANEEESPGEVTNEPGQTEEIPQQQEQPGAETPAQVIDEGNGDQPVQIAEVDPQIADVVKSLIKVDSLAGSIDKVMEIAQANGAESSRSLGTTMQAMDAQAAREISIKAPRDQVGAILDQLADLGSASAPIAEQVELTEQYREAVITIEAIDQEIERLQDQGREEDLPRIEDLKKQSKIWGEKKAQIESDANLVTIKVYLVEETVQP